MHEGIHKTIDMLGVTVQDLQNQLAAAQQQLNAKDARIKELEERIQALSVEPKDRA